MKIFSKLKQIITNLPENKLIKKYLIWVIILDFLASLLPTFSYDGMNVIKAIYTTRNLSWPPQLNLFNLGILKDVIITLLFEFVLTVIITILLLVIFSFIINKIFNLFKKDVSFLKLCNISLYADLVSYVLSIIGWLLFIPFSYIFEIYSVNQYGGAIFTPIFLIWQLIAYLLIYGSGIVGLIIYIYGIKISLKDYIPKIKQ